MKPFLTLILSLCFFAGKAQVIKGTIVNKKPVSSEVLSVLTLLDSANTSKGMYMSDLEGRFMFTNVARGTYSIRVDNMLNGDTTFTNIHITGDTSLVLDTYKFCPYDASVNDKTCPVCHKKNEVIPIRYGLIISIDGSEKNEEDGVTYLSGGCNVSNCDPHWYCKRDKKRF